MIDNDVLSWKVHEAMIQIAFKAAKTFPTLRSPIDDQWANLGRKPEMDWDVVV